MIIDFSESRVSLAELVQLMERKGEVLVQLDNKKYAARERTAPKGVRFLRARNDNPTFQGPGSAA